MPTDSDEEDWYDRRRRLDLEEGISRIGMEGGGAISPSSYPSSTHQQNDQHGTQLRRPLTLARNQAFAMAGLLADYDDGYEETYRPDPTGPVRLPYSPSTRTVLHPIDLHPPQSSSIYHQSRHHPRSGNGRYHHPAGGADGSGGIDNQEQQRRMRRHGPGGGHHDLTDRLVGEALQLGPYTDPRLVEVARRELAEAYQMDDRQMDSAAFHYLEHMGGIRPEDIHDINQYSQHDLLRPVNLDVDEEEEGDDGEQEHMLHRRHPVHHSIQSPPSPAHPIMRQHQQGQGATGNPHQQRHEDDDLLLVTTL